LLAYIRAWWLELQGWSGRAPGQPTLQFAAACRAHSRSARSSRAHTWRHTDPFLGWAHTKKCVCRRGGLPKQAASGSAGSVHHAPQQRQQQGRHFQQAAYQQQVCQQPAEVGRIGPGGQLRALRHACYATALASKVQATNLVLCVLEQELLDIAQANWQQIDAINLTFTLNRQVSACKGRCLDFYNLGDNLDCMHAHHWWCWVILGSG
jgi:hypothetical protein